MKHFKVFVSVGFFSFAASAQAIPSSGCVEVMGPPGFVCGQHGFVTNKKLKGPGAQTVEDSNACRDLCLRHRAPRKISIDPRLYGCKSFSFNSTSKLCEMYPGKLESSPRSGNGFHGSGQGFHRDDSLTDIKFWNYRCFKCPEVCPQSKDTTILDNSGFELSPDYIGPWSNFTDFVPDPGYDRWTIVLPGHRSSRAASCTSDSEDIPCFLQQTVFLCPGHIYALRFDYRIQAAERDIHSCTLALNTETMSVQFSNFSHSSDGPWNTVTTIIPQLLERTPYQHLDFISESIYCTYYLDNVELFPVTTPLSVRPGSTSVLSNGGFESSALAPWSVTSPRHHTKSRYSIQSPGIKSDRALYIATAMRRRKSQDLYLSQPITVAVNTPYVLSFDYEIGDGPAHSINVFAGDYQWFTSTPFSSKNGSHLHRFTGMFTSKAAKSVLLVEVTTSTLDDSGGPPLILDNFSIKEFSGKFDS